LLEKSIKAMLLLYFTILNNKSVGRREVKLILVEDENE